MRHIPSRGFTLIEILVALGIVVAMLFSLMALVRLSVLQSSVHREEIALSIVTSEIESLRVAGYASLPTSGTFSHSSLALLPDGVGTLTVSEYAGEGEEEGGESALASVTVTVSWTGRTGSARSTTLSTLMSEVGGLL